MDQFINKNKSADIESSKQTSRPNSRKNRETLENQLSVKNALEISAQKNKYASLFDVCPQQRLSPLPHHKTKIKIDKETRKRLDRFEYWHFLSIQLRWFTIVTFLTSLTGAGVFVLSFFSMDVDKIAPRWIVSDFVESFKFGCNPNHLSKWDTEVTK